jgi:hypothetical protein
MKSFARRVEIDTSVVEHCSSGTDRQAKMAETSLYRDINVDLDEDEFYDTTDQAYQTSNFLADAYVQKQSGDGDGELSSRLFLLQCPLHPHDQRNQLLMKEDLKFINIVFFIPFTCFVPLNRLGRY